ATDLARLVAEGDRLYSLKQYDEASDKYADACEVNMELNGVDDADLLLKYGKSLFAVAVNTSQVLGSVEPEIVAAADSEDDEEPDAQPVAGVFTFEGGPVEGDEPDEAAEVGPEEAPKVEIADEDTPEGDGAGTEPDAGVTDDFEEAWTILDLARTLLEKELSEKQGKLTAEEIAGSEEGKSILKKLADIYDLLGEISLESESFTQAVIDLKESLKLKQQIFAETSPEVSECHYKLSLALEYDIHNENSKEEAIEQLEKAIDGVKAQLKSGESADKELLSDLQLRLKELKEGKDIDSDKTLEEELQEEIKAKIAASLAGETAMNDLSGFVRKKK
ncbi:hypothetical protein CANCADRAFT_14927, partial [Tortispora caseinolytica NRRL Y-17796]